MDCCFDSHSVAWENKITEERRIENEKDDSAFAFPISEDKKIAQI